MKGRKCNERLKQARPRRLAAFSLPPTSPHAAADGGRRSSTTSPPSTACLRACGGMQGVVMLVWWWRKRRRKAHSCQSFSAKSFSARQANFTSCAPVVGWGCVGTWAGGMGLEGSPGKCFGVADEIGEWLDCRGELGRLRWRIWLRRRRRASSLAAARKRPAAIYTIRATSLCGARSLTATTYRSRHTQRPTASSKRHERAQQEAAPPRRRSSEGWQHFDEDEDTHGSLWDV